MFGIRYMKAEPHIYLQQYRSGKVIREGRGLQFFYYAPMTSLVAIPVAATEAPFIFEESTRDFQQVTTQGHVSYRVKDPRRLAQILNLTLRSDAVDYASDDWKQLHQRVVNAVKVLVRSEIQSRVLREAIAEADQIGPRIRTALEDAAELNGLGLEVLGFTILAIKPTPETARALEAETRESLLQEADEALYTRRNAAVEQERAIKENELNTEIAIENKKRQIRETQMEAERAIQEKQHQLQQDDLRAQTHHEEQRRTLVDLSSENAKTEADARAYGIEQSMQAIGKADAKTLQALASAGMDAEHLIAMAFQGLADNAQNIGQLNITPDLLRELLDRKK